MAAEGGEAVASQHMQQPPGKLQTWPRSRDAPSPFIEVPIRNMLMLAAAMDPFLACQRSGHILHVSSIGGISALPTVGAHHASKWAVEGFSQALAAEVKHFGIHVTLIEPSGFSTDWGGPSAYHVTALPAYVAMRAKAGKLRAARLQKQGDPLASSGAVLRLVDGEQPPLRVFFGDGPLGIAKADYEGRVKT